MIGSLNYKINPNGYISSSFHLKIPDRDCIFRLLTFQKRGVEKWSAPKFQTRDSAEIRDFFGEPTSWNEILAALKNLEARNNLPSSPA
jgi:hypothetical protein